MIQNIFECLFATKDVSLRKTDEFNYLFFIVSIENTGNVFFIFDYIILNIKTPQKHSRELTSVLIKFPLLCGTLKIMFLLVKELFHLKTMK